MLLLKYNVRKVTHFNGQWFSNDICHRVTLLSKQKTSQCRVTMFLVVFQVENKPSEFSLIIVHDNGAMEKLDVSECPINTRLNLGPSEVCKCCYTQCSNDDIIIGCR